MASSGEGTDVDDIVQATAAEPTASAPDTLVNGSSNDTAAASDKHVEDMVSRTEDPTAASTETVGVVDLSGENDASTDVAEAGSSVGDVDVSTEQVGVKKAVKVDAGPEDDAVEGSSDSNMVDVVTDADETAKPRDAGGETDTVHREADNGVDVQDTDHDHQHHRDEEEETDDEDARCHDDADHDQGAVDNDGNDDDDDMQHNDDEYDPANPTHDLDAEDAYDSAEQQPDSTDHAQDEYDPANPTEGFEMGDEKKADVSSPVRKRKLPDTPTVGSAASPTAANASARSPKRPRSSTTAHKVDQRGLKNSAWDRLMDFESTGEFRIAQVSRAAFSTIALLPEFAQCAIVARFTRTPMKDIRDKNELILRLCREYLGENPSISSLQPASVFIDDATADPGLFAYGYAPPTPISGVSSVKIPFRQDKPGTISTPSAPSAEPVKLPKPAALAVSSKPQLDEFGRVILPSSAPSQDETAVAQAAARATAPPTSTQAAAPAALPTAGAGKPSDPRRRRQGGADTASVESASPSTDPRGQIEKSDVYNRLPISVRSRLDGLIATRRLREAINDNVLSRLNHLPESMAVTAIEKFMESDLGQISNVNGFLVGIINRVQERGSASGDPRNSVPASRSAHVPATTFHQQQQETPHQSQQHFSHATVPQHGYTGPSAPHGAPVPVGHPHSFDHAAGIPHFRDHQMQRPMAPAPVGYDAPPAWNQAHAAAPVQYSAQSAPPTGGQFSSHHTIDKAIAALPVAIQNHLVSLVNSRILPSLDDLSEKCYEVLGQLSEGLANDVLKRFGTANLVSVRNRSAFLMGVVKKCRQEYGFD